MSLYGNIKKIGSASFQFDRKYNNRHQMDNNASIDGVYAGRYVLVEYGYRFGKSDENIFELDSNTAIDSTPTTEYVYQSIPDDASYDSEQTYYIFNYDEDQYVEYTYNPITWQTHLQAGTIYKKVQKLTYHLINTADGSVRVDGVVENEDYRYNAEQDLKVYGAIYDSTVWQKVYINGKDKYVMVAELNAMAPKLDITQDTPLTYKVTDNDIPNYRTNGIISGKLNERGELIETVRLTNVKEINNKAYFDTALDTELTYLMHLPTTLNLELNNDTVDFNENGFNMVYSYPESEGVSTIAWIPKGHDAQGNPIYLDDYDYRGDGSEDNGGNPFGYLRDGVYNMDTKMLFMSFPALGNAMNAIYNLIYGKPDPEDDVEHGAMRPYFKRYLGNLTLTNRAYVKDRENAIKFVECTLYDERDYDHYIWIEGKVGTTVEAIMGEDEALIKKDYLEPRGLVEVRYKDNNTQQYYQLTSQHYLDLPRDPDTHGVLNDGAYVLWDILRNESIVMSIHKPTGDEDPNMEWLSQVPGLSDILANADSGLATVLSSVFGTSDPLTGTTKYYLFNDWTMSSEDGGSGPAIINKPTVVGGYPQTFITVQNLASNKNIIGEIISESPGYMWDYSKTTATQIGYPHTEIVTSKTFSGGSYSIDFENWQLVDYTIPNIPYTIDKMATAPSGANQSTLQANLNKVKVSKLNNRVSFSSTSALTKYTDADYGEGYWVLFDIDTGFRSIQRLKLDNVILTDETENAMRLKGAEKGHILLMIDADAVRNTPRIVKIEAAGFNAAEFTITYVGVR